MINFIRAWWDYIYWTSPDGFWEYLTVVLILAAAAYVIIKVIIPIGGS